MIHVERKSSSFVLSCFLSDGALSNAFNVGVCPVPDQTAWSVELMEGCFCCVILGKSSKWICVEVTR